jgi:RNA polymerase primary sigma factor
VGEDRHRRLTDRVEPGELGEHRIEPSGDIERGLSLWATLGEHTPARSLRSDLLGGPALEPSVVPLPEVVDDRDLRAEPGELAGPQRPLERAGEDAVEAVGREPRPEQRRLTLAVRVECEVGRPGVTASLGPRSRSVADEHRVSGKRDDRGVPDRLGRGQRVPSGHLARIAGTDESARRPPGRGYRLGGCCLAGNAAPVSCVVKHKSKGGSAIPATKTDDTVTPELRGAGPDPMRLFLDDLGRHPLLGPQEQVELAKRVANGDETAREQMISSNLRLVVHWARRYQGRGVDLIDLVQEGTFGLMRAVEKFDWERGFRFSTYATWWIRQSLQRAVQSKGRTIRLPEDALAAELEAEGESHLPRVVASLDQPLQVDGSATLGDVVASVEAEFEDEIATELLHEELEQAVGRLPELERAVVRLRFGLDGAPPASLETTARMLGIGVRRVRRIETEALQFLAAQPELEGVHDAA